jgi:hypothetical protein
VRERPTVSALQNRIITLDSQPEEPLSDDLVFLANGVSLKLTRAELMYLVFVNGREVRTGHMTFATSTIKQGEQRASVPAYSFPCLT